MRNMIRVLVAAVLVLSFGGAVMAADVVRIGHTVSLTGGASMWGQSEARAIDMLVKKINDAGGVLGKKIEVVRYDNRNDAVEAVDLDSRERGTNLVRTRIFPVERSAGHDVNKVTHFIGNNMHASRLFAQVWVR